MSRTLVVGDVHGCAGELEDLLKAVSFSKGDRLVLVGDLVHKGPDSVGVVRMARELGARAVRGNHDENLIRLHRGAFPSAKKALIDVAKTFGDEDWRWLEKRPLWLALGAHHLVVHGGFVPGIPLERQSRTMMMNLRSIRADGSPTTRLDGQPWASLWPGPKKVLFGHDAMRGLQQYPHALGLDTGCVYGGRLTGWLLEEERLVSVAARRMWCKP